MLKHGSLFSGIGGFDLAKACEIGANPLEVDGWYEFMGENLKLISISGDLNYNIEIMPAEQHNFSDN